MASPFAHETKLSFSLNDVFKAVKHYRAEIAALKAGASIDSERAMAGSNNHLVKKLTSVQKGEEIGKNIWKTILSVPGMMLEGGKWVLGKLWSGAKWVGNKAKSLWDGLKSVVGGTWNFMKNVTETGWGILKGLGEAMFSSGKATISNGGLLTAGITAVGGIAGGLSGGLAAYGAYKLYSLYTSDKNNYLYRLRFIEYGIDPDDKKTAGAVADLENVLYRTVKCVAGHGATMDTTMIPMKSLATIFGFDTQDATATQKAMLWFLKRFTPVYLSWLTEAFVFTKKLDLSGLDKSLKKEQKLTLIDASYQMANRHSPFSVMASPFHGEDELDYGHVSVWSHYELIRFHIYRLPGDTEAKKESHKQAPAKPKPQQNKPDTSNWIEKSTKTSLKSVKDFGKDMWADLKSYGSSASSDLADATQSVIGTAKNAYQGAVNLASSGIEETAGFYQNYIKPLVGNAKVVKSALVAAMISAGILNPVAQAMILSQVAVESGNFKDLEENLNYKPETLLKISKRAQQIGPQATARIAAQGPQAVAALMYDGRMGNTAPGDGWKYRGRGVVQLTGKDEYIAASKALGIDLVNNPDLASDPKIAAKIAVWYFKHNVGTQALDSGDVNLVTKRVNGGYNGLQKRQALFTTYLNQIQKQGLTTTDPHAAKILAVTQPKDVSQTHASASTTPSESKPRSVPSAIAPKTVALTPKAPSNMDIAKASGPSGMATDAIADRQQKAAKAQAIQVAAQQHSLASSSANNMNSLVDLTRSSLSTQQDIHDTLGQIAETLKSIVSKNAVASLSRNNQGRAGSAVASRSLPPNSDVGVKGLSGPVSVRSTV